MAGAAFFVWFPSAYKRDMGTCSPTLLFVPAAGILFMTLVLSGTAAAVKALATNLFAEEGLRGFSEAAALIVWILSCTRPRFLDEASVRNAASVGALTVSSYLFSTYLDQSGSGTNYPKNSTHGFWRFAESHARHMASFLGSPSNYVDWA